MMKTKPNRLIQIALLILVTLGMLVFLLKPDVSEKRFSAADWQQTHKSSRQDADTPQETLRVIQAQLKELQKQNAAIVKENERLKRDQRRTINQIDQRVDAQIKERDKTQNAALIEARAFIERMTQRQEALFASKAQPEELPTVVEKKPLVVMPLDWKPQNRRVRLNGSSEKVSSDNGFLQKVAAYKPQVLQMPERSLSDAPPPKRKAATRAYIRIPVGTTLAASVAWTGIIGRIPVNGAVADPYPWKAIVRADNLAAMGFRIPELKGAIVGGYVAGDFALSCAQPRVRYITFLFEDGTVYTHEGDSGDPVQSLQSSNSLGYAGNPCLQGKYIGNAHSYITNQILLGAASTAGYALAQGETTTQTSVIGGTSSTSRDGDLGPFVAGQALTGGVSEVQEWLDSVLENSFGAIVVPPLTRIDINIEKEIIIYYKEGAKIRHDQGLAVQYSGRMD